MRNIITLTDSYKLGHFNMYPDDTDGVYSYFESRRGARFNNTVLFGLQGLIKEYLIGRVVTYDKINRARELVDAHIGPGVFNEDGWRGIYNQRDGRLPIRIKAVPEGLPIPTSNVLVTVENTLPHFPWLTNYLETLLSQIWYSSTVCTLSREIKLLCKHYLDNTSDDKGGLDFMLHDFGFRGVSSVESAGRGGAGHIVNFNGTDTVAAIEYAQMYYEADVTAFSVSATEHSIMTALGENGEKDILGQLLKKYPTGILSVVIDSYDYVEFIKMAHDYYEDEIMKRNGTVVFRPDSGDPVAVTNEVLDLLGERFGATSNRKGYKILRPSVKVLWGDGIDYMGIRNILHSMKESNWAASNIIFGCGGGLLQKLHRDVQRFAFKSSAQRRGGVWTEIFKKPTDVSKMSKKGRLALVKDDKDRYQTLESVSPTTSVPDVLQTVFEDGILVRDMTWDQVRENARI